MTAMRRLVKGSTVVRRAWGMTMRRRIWPKVRPMERAASIWPTLIVLMPLMKFSVPKEAPRSTVVTMTQVW